MVYSLEMKHLLYESKNYQMPTIKASYNFSLSQKGKKLKCHLEKTKLLQTNGIIFLSDKEYEENISMLTCLKWADKESQWSKTKPKDYPEIFQLLVKSGYIINSL